MSYYDNEESSCFSVFAVALLALVISGLIIAAWNNDGVYIDDGPSYYYVPAYAPSIDIDVDTGHRRRYSGPARTTNTTIINNKTTVKTTAAPPKRTSWWSSSSSPSRSSSSYSRPSSSSYRSSSSRSSGRR